MSSEGRWEDAERRIRALGPSEPWTGQLRTLALRTLEPSDLARRTLEPSDPSNLRTSHRRTLAPSHPRVSLVSVLI